MKTLKIILIVIATLAIVTVTAIIAFEYFKPKPAGIFVSSKPPSSVYLNGNFVGKTPFQKTLAAGTVDIKLVPDISDQNLFPFETKITLTGGIQTLVRREFGTSEETSSGDIISFEGEGGADAGLIVVSTPDNAHVLIDGKDWGFSPTKLSSVMEGEHQIAVKVNGYIDRVMNVNTKSGYRLTLFAKLAKSADSINTTPTPTPAPTPSGMVVILQTPTGYLRVRTEPGTNGEEIAQVKPGDKFPYLGSDPDTGWLKIQFEDPQPGLPNGIVGWVSDQFAKEVSPSATIAK